MGDSVVAKANKLPEARAELSLPDKKPLFSEAEARAEAERCLYCSDAPCIKACPTSIDIPTFIKKIATGNVRGSARTILSQNILGYSCARVCPVEVLCEGSCVYNGWNHQPIKIGKLQRYATQHGTQELSTHLLGTPKPLNGKKVACVGAGPASLAFAAYLRLEGVHSVLFEKRSVAGGLNTTGVAPYKLHAHDALHEVEWLASLGVEFRFGVEIGKQVTSEELLRDYDAVFLGIGLGADSMLGIPGEEGPGVEGATAWIERMKLDPKDSVALAKRVVVVGGGNTAIDVARETALLGASEVHMVYRRSAKDMSGYVHEMEGARKEGVQLVENVQPVRVLRDEKGAVRAIELAPTKDGKPDNTAPTRELACDQVLLAIGQAKFLDLAKAFPGVELDKKGCVVAAAGTGKTGNPKVFAGGDCINGGKEVVNAVADGRDAARFLLSQWAREA